MSKEWRCIECSICGGYGLVSQYLRDDFEGAENCRSCDGAGVLWVSPAGRLALYPGGPLRGSIARRTPT